MALIPTDPVAFPTRQELRSWFTAHHETHQQLWVRIFKKGSGTQSVTWDDCVIESIAWGWIDGIKQRCDEASYFQRLTPRRPRSNWSQRNCTHADQLIRDGLMMPPGLAQVEAAKVDGRWDAAYAGSRDMEIPTDFLAKLDENPEARAFYATLNRANLFAIYHRLHSAKKPETRARRMEQIIAQLGQQKKFY
ncbi:YdeI/OmpD-associated family protein [Loktanella sp. IMCC34160]|uniref:YdeI/OmpD-associated family protein n=1 Tax=Loktanella sp. IMCC34160 TaxID=2510646 RepID=UPI001A923EAC|nr:YdeI/OmpD-associated family protein [Loktanella sp. IMCC34160]